jgi:hypothetical protein
LKNKNIIQDIKRQSMKKKAIKVEYRKDSESFPEWLKYEITILNEDGTTDKVPAYGKDLQDALSRVVHDERAEKIQSKTNLIPWWAWVIVYFAYMATISTWSINANSPGVILFGLLGTILFILGMKKLTTKRNKDLKQ